jgi:lipopolysaccharide heptosyltransferase I
MTLAVPPAPRRVLLIKPSSLGDVISAVPVLRGLRRSFPEAHLAWLVNENCAAVIDYDEDLDETILFDRNALRRCLVSPADAGKLLRFAGLLRRGNFDWAIDLQGLFRSGIMTWLTKASVRAGFAKPRESLAAKFYTHRIETTAQHTIDRNIELARALGVDARGEDFRLVVPPQGLEFAEDLARRGLVRGRYVVCVPPTRWPSKLYPVRHWRAVVKELLQQSPVALSGTRDDVKLCEAVAEGLGPNVHNLAGRTNIPQLLGLLAGARGVICSDSAAQFMGPAVGTPVITLMGPTRPERTGPRPPGRGIVSGVACQGCLRRKCRHVSCMEAIWPQQVLAAVAETFPSPR